jgi:two-component system KDP operon response regulator KdpE
MNENETILIIDDELQIRRLLEITLSASGYKIIQSVNGKDGLVDAATHHPSLIILDLGLPDIDGQEILKKLREWFSKPVIVLSVRNSEEDIIKALDNGANDYLSKPFRTGELLARIRAAIRGSENKADDSVLETGSLVIDLVSHVVRKNNEIVKLTATEFSLPISIF